MSEMKWKDAYSTGVAKIDNDHKRIIEMINTTYAACQAEGVDRCPCNVISDMREYATSHFRLEEGLMEAHQYPDVESHMSEHRYFMGKVEELEAMAKNGDEPDITELYRFLSIWLMSHVMNCDKKLGAFLIEIGEDDF